MTAPFTPSTGSASISTTEFSLPSNSTTRVAQTTACRLTGHIDLSNMVAGDQYRIRVYDKINGSAQQVLFEGWPTGAQSGAYVLPERAVNEGWDVTLLLITGSARTVGWALKLDVADVNVASLTAGAITATSIASAAITAAKFATDAIDSNALAATAVTEIQTGLATSAAVASVQSDTTTLTGRLTSTRATNLDNLDAAVTTRASAATALSTVQWTNGRATNLDSLDVTVSSRAPSSTALSTATWTNGRAALIDHLDADVSTRAPASTAVSNVDYTSARALKIDNLDATVSSRAPSSTALSTAQWTNTRAGLIDHLDADISTRAPASTALSTVQWTNIRAATIDNLNASVSSRATPGDILTAQNALASAISAVNTDTDDIQARLPAALDGSGNIKAGVQSLTGSALTAITDAIFAVILEPGAVSTARTFLQRMRIGLSIIINKANNLAITAATTEHFRDGGDTKDRAVYTLDLDGTRVPTTLDGD
jgi:hypothetical protein